MTFGYNVEVSDKETIAEDYKFDRLYSEFYDCYNIDEIPDFIEPHNRDVSVDDENSRASESIPAEAIQSLDGPMDSPWSMYCHDTRHTGRSPYSTVDTWDEIWRFKQDANDFVRGSPVVGDDGTIYFGGSGDFYALYPNGTMKWKYDGLDFYVWSAPAIDENGVIYVGDKHAYFYAINPNGILKWIYGTEGDIMSSPAIGDDGTIYFGNEVGYPLGGYINALYPNGTVKWRFKTGHVVYSSPAIGPDGTIYCGCHDTYLYALYPNNGTVKWKYKTGHWVRVSPCIADDGTIYVVSLDSCLHAVYPNGTLKWKTDVGAGTSPTIGQDGTIYCGYTKLHAINPTNGSIKWTFDPGSSRTIRGATPCHSAEDIIYFGTHIGDYGGGEIIAVNPDGTERWRKKIANKYVDSAPAIGEDGTVYIGSSSSEGPSYGYLHAFGIGELQADADGPYYGLIDSPVEFEGSSKGGYSPHTFHWDFGDDHTSEEQNPTYTYTDAGNYTVTLTVTDNSSNSSSDTTWAWIQMSNTPPNKPTIIGETNGKTGESYDYTFTATDPDESIIWYYVDWGDGSSSGWVGPFDSGQQMILSHSWSNKGTYNISVKAKDPYDAEGPWGYLEVEMPVNQYSSNHQMSNTLLFQILGRILNRLQL